MRRYVQAACLLSAMVFASSSNADNARTAEAEARFNEGVKLADSGSFDQARLKFLQALEMKKVSSILFNLAGVEMKTGHEVEAVDHYRAFLKLAPNDPRVTDALIDTAKKNIADALKRVGAIEVEAPAETKISVDGRVLEEFPSEPVAVSPGKHTVQGSLHGKTASVGVEAPSGQVAHAKLEFPVSDAASGAAPVAVAPVTAPAEEGQRTTLGWALPIGLGVLGVAGVVTGAAFAGASNSSKSDLDAQREATPGICASPRGPACAVYEDKVSDVNSQATLSYVGYGVGAAALAASVLTFVLLPKTAPSTRPESAARVEPVMGPRMAGANLHLSF